MARFDVRVTDNFIEEVACIENERMVLRLQMIAESLCGNPRMGTPCEDEGIVSMYGDGLYAYGVAAFEILYRFDGSRVDLLGLTLTAPQS